MSASKMTLGQLVDILSILWKALLGREVEWDSVSCETAQAIIKGNPKSFANQFVRFLANGGRAILGSLKIVSVPFDPVTFIAAGWSVLSEEQDKSSAVLTEVDFSKAEFLTCLVEGESSITGEEKLVRLRKLGRTLYGATIFMGLWQDYQAQKENSVLERLYQDKGVAYVDFFGDILRNPDGDRYVLCLYRSGDGRWGWGYGWLGGAWGERDFSAVSQQVS